jgi:branched-subunit amino acid ABC-type transport system permease component
VRFVGGVLRSLQLTFVGGVGFGFVQSLLSEGFFRDFVITQKSFLYLFFLVYFDCL